MAGAASSESKILLAIIESVTSSCAPVAQLDRASGYEPEGRVFESLRAHHRITHKKHLLAQSCLAHKKHLLVQSCLAALKF